MSDLLQAINLPFAEAIEFFRGKANVKTERWTDVWKEAHTRSFMVAGAASDDLVEDFRKSVDKAISEGTTLEEFRRDFDKIVADHGWEHTGSAARRSSIIYETNLSMAYSAGRYTQMCDPDVTAFFPYWRYRHGDSVHPRPMHLAWDGTTLRCDDGFWATHYAPNGWKCSCWVEPVSEGDLARMGKTGPDKAPEITYHDWVDKTGQVHRVPDGIDPGFDYNPGMAWKSPVKADPEKELK
jgi:uncharacterized protein with gpF-like domain